MNSLIEIISGYINPQTLLLALTQKTETASNQLLAEFPVVSDSEILKLLLPDNTRLAVFDNLTGIYAASFIIRHGISRLSLELHKMYFPQAGIQGSDSHEYSLSSPFFQYKDLQLIPGFSPLGIHLQTRKKGLCRAFDLYEIQSCDHPGSPFCTKHQTEFWWHDNPATGSTQAKMFHFYLDAANIMQYNEGDLQHLNQSFWDYYRQKKQSIDSVALAFALKLFGFKDTSELLATGKTGLRKIYLSLALSHHPDQGGEEKQFILIRESYENLLVFLEKDLF